MRYVVQHGKWCEVAAHLQKQAAYKNFVVIYVCRSLHGVISYEVK